MLQVQTATTKQRSEVTKRQFSEICGIQTRIDFKAFAADIDLKHNENE